MVGALRAAAFAGEWEWERKMLCARQYGWLQRSTLSSSVNTWLKRRPVHVVVPCQPPLTPPRKSDKDESGSVGGRKPPPPREHLQILHKCDNYLVIDKHFDHRIYGDFEHTVEKLLVAQVLERCTCKPAYSRVRTDPLLHSMRMERMPGPATVWTMPHPVRMNTHTLMRALTKA